MPSACHARAICIQALSDFDKVNLIKQASLRNYLTSHQVKSLLDVVSYRKGKLEVAVQIARACVWHVHRTLEHVYGSASRAFSISRWR